MDRRDYLDSSYREQLKVHIHELEKLLKAKKDGWCKCIGENIRLRKALKEIDTECHRLKPLSTVPEIETIHDIATEALKEGT